jgi:hypothetical protein
MRRALTCLLSIAAAGSLWLCAAAAAQSTQVLIVPPSITVAAGSTVTVDVRIQDVPDLYALDLQLAFDPALLEVQDADGTAANGTQIAAGNFLSSPYGFTALNQVDNITGTIRYVYSLLSPAVGVSGSGILASITFRARDPGSSALRLQMVLANSQAAYISAVVSDGLIVVSGDTATPTRTMTHTPTPTSTSTATAAVTLTPSCTPTCTPTRPTPDHFMWLPLLLGAHSVPTLTPLPSATPTPTTTHVPSPTASATPTLERSPSPTPTASVLPSATPTVAPTSSPSPTGTVTPVSTLSATPTPTASPIPSPTASATPTGPATPSPTPESRQLLLNPGFETDAGWALEGAVPPVYTMQRAHGGVRSVRLGIILPQTGAVYSSVRQEVDLPDHLSAALLSLYYFPAGWPEDADHLYLYVTRVSDGATLFSDSWMQWEQTWHAYTVDLLSGLQPYAGQRVRLRVGVYNNGDGMTAVFLDDVELWVAGAY